MFVSSVLEYIFHEAAPHSNGAVSLIYQSGTKDIVESSLVYNRQCRVAHTHFSHVCFSLGI